MESAVRVNWKEYKIAAKYATEINAGYSANLFGIGDCPYIDGEDLDMRREAWRHGHQQAQRHLQGDLR